MIRDLTKFEVKQMLEKHIWRQECPVDLSRLKIVEITHVDFQGKQNKGHLVVLDVLARNVEQIFVELLRIQFPIHQIKNIVDFDGDDVCSMKANNSSSFNGRLVARTNRWSSHAYGAAIDINPIQNPYLLLNEQMELQEVIPLEGEGYINRTTLRKGMVEEIVPIFANYGFSEWGGSWIEKPDYHHFQLPWQEIWDLFPVNE